MTNRKKKVIEKQVPQCNTFSRIEDNKQTITRLLSKSTTKRLNSFNWLRHEISFTEPRTLFHVSAQQQAPYFDHSCTRGLGEAYDYILKRGIDKNPITFRDVCEIHYLLCNGTNIKINDTFIRAGVIKKTNVPLEIESKLVQIIDNCLASDKTPFIKAFDIHYQIILLQPFDDYNKRTARLVMNLILISNGYRPIAFTRKTDKKQYPSALLQMKQGNAKSYYRYMVNAMLASQEKIINQLKTSKIK